MIEPKRNIKRSVKFTRCYKCFRPNKLCLCSYVIPLKTSTKFVILMHPKEFKEERVGTGKLTSLQLQNSEIIVGVNFDESKRVVDLIRNEQNSCFVLYPTEDSLNLSSSSQKIKNKKELSKKANNVVFIIDGTWFFAKKMMASSKCLQTLKAISFDSNIVSKFTFKQQPYKYCLSTIESVKFVLDSLVELECETIDTSSFLLPLEKLTEQQIYFQMNPPKGSYRSQKIDSQNTVNKTNYKSKSSRNLIFKKEKPSEC